MKWSGDDHGKELSVGRASPDPVGGGVGEGGGGFQLNELKNMLPKKYMRKQSNKICIVKIMMLSTSDPESKPN